MLLVAAILLLIAAAIVPILALAIKLGFIVPPPIGPPDIGPHPMPTTIGDLINADETAFSDQASKADAAARADADLANANVTLTTADASLAGGLAAVGPAFTIDTNGSVVVYFGDSSSKGFHKITPVPVTAPLPGSPVMDPVADVTPGA